MVVDSETIEQTASMFNTIVHYFIMSAGGELK